MTKSPHVLLALSRYDYRTHRGVAKFAAKHNWHLNCEMAITGKIPKDWQGDGIVTLLSDNHELVNYVTRADVPFVDLSIMRDDIEALRVTADNDAIGKLAGEYFLQRGYKNYAFYATTTDKVARIRRDNFFEQVNAFANTISDWGIGENEKDWESKISILKNQLLSASLPLALFAARDLDASIALDACIQANLNVPEQVAILGVDNNELITDSLQVPLSSINHDVERLGYEGASLLNSILNGESTDNHTQLILPTGVTTRRSTDYLAVNDEIVKKALTFMKLKFTQAKFALDEISDHCLVSRKTLDSRFNNALGHSIHTELNNMRMRSAVSALIETNTPVIDISNTYGFNTPQYFNSRFKTQFGVTPVAYRKKYQHNVK